MKKLLTLTATALCLLGAVNSCGNKTDGPAEEVLTKKAFSQLVINYDGYKDFHEGVCVVIDKDYNRGLINTEGKEIVPCQYKEIYDCQDGMMRYEDKKYKNGFIDKKGKVIIEAIYDEANDFSDGMSAVKKDGKWGFINTKGKEVIPLQYNSAHSFHCELASVRIDYDSSWGYINKKGEMAIKPNFDSAEDFSEGYALVRKDWKNYFIDTEGTIVLAEGEKIQYIGYEFKNGLLPAIDLTTGKCGYLNPKGEWAIAADLSYAMPFEGEYAYVVSGSKVYKMSKDGKKTDSVTDQDILEDIYNDADFEDIELKLDGLEEDEDED